MAKQRRPEPQPASSRTTIAILAVGGLLVAALVAWALTRTVEPAPPAAVADTGGYVSSTPTPTTAPPPAPLTATQTATQTASPFPPAEHEQSEEKTAVPRIAVEDLREKMKTNAVTVIDVRDDASFAAGHIPGSLHIPFARVEGEMSTLPKGKPIVTYCT
ncbi:MAG TPA: rhodanese-like domain-containing protein [Thermoanaerobaculia bacterium]|nr:rhodanese-like domain-containing protein [Thermoanaerobaculia bacterium]